MSERASGILLHISSLPAPFGIGDLGSALHFVDFLVDSGQSCWQFLPLGPTSSVFGNSPYMSFSAFAGVVYPGGVIISNFESDKVIYQPKERLEIVFNVTYTVIDNHINDTAKKLDVQVWIERELESPFLATSKVVKLTKGNVVQAPVHNAPFIATPEMIKSKQLSMKLLWLHGGKNVYGHRAWLRIVDEQGRLLAEKEAFFDIADQWWQ
ncbi:MAG: 4-alpha-glucanotransferase, partial [Candidatus Marinimicrobia bacterium]|nr:4-alpha-glucanotransferase [Candidatus Neomarinimicrobiota bacterium]